MPVAMHPSPVVLVSLTPVRGTYEFRQASFAPPVRWYEVSSSLSEDSLLAVLGKPKNYKCPRAGWHLSREMPSEPGFNLVASSLHLGDTY